MPIVIGDKKYRGKGVGAKVVRTLIQRGRELGYDTLYVDEIYHFNEGSRVVSKSVDLWHMRRLRRVRNTN